MTTEFGFLLPRAISEAFVVHGVQAEEKKKKKKKKGGVPFV